MGRVDAGISWGGTGAFQVQLAPPQAVVRWCSLVLDCRFVYPCPVLGVPGLPVVLVV